MKSNFVGFRLDCVEVYVSEILKYSNFSSLHFLLLLLCNNVICRKRKCLEKVSASGNNVMPSSKCNIKSLYRNDEKDDDVMASLISIFAIIIFCNLNIWADQSDFLFE